MDLLEEIRKKMASLAGNHPRDGVNAVVRHVEIAERYLMRARAENDEDLYNDVIYRTNQAFEGMLKEAYTVLTDEDGAKLSPHQIEQHLMREKVFAPRVLDLFTNYRRQWRNPSTHDYKLFFSDQEALLAIVSVSAFTNILLDQIIETISFKHEKEKLQLSKQQLQDRSNFQGALVHEEVITLLELFSEELARSIPDSAQLIELELIGKLHAFIESIDPDLNVVREPPISGHPKLRPDFLIQKDNSEVVIEVKRATLNEKSVEVGLKQLLSYLGAAKFQQGILYIPPFSGGRIRVTSSTWKVDGREVRAHAVIPWDYNLDVVEALMVNSN